MRPALRCGAQAWDGGGAGSHPSLDSHDSGQETGRRLFQILLALACCDPSPLSLAGQEALEYTHVH